MFLPSLCKRPAVTQGQRAGRPVICLTRAPRMLLERIHEAAVFLISWSRDSLVEGGGAEKKRTLDSFSDKFWTF